jgi:hypothetical protein
MTDYKFDIDGKKLSSEDIEAKKDYDSFYKGVQAKSKTFNQKNWFWASTGLASLAIASFFLFANSNDELASNNHILNKEETIFVDVKEKPFINPPFTGLRVDSDIFKVNSNKGGVFKSRYGSILRIPALAFFNTKGKTISNKTVVVRFTEYRDVADQIISGIPMTYDSAGTKYMFSSAGMIQIKGFIGDSAVNLNPEKPIKVEMKSDYSSTEYNFYCLNEKNKKWDYLGKDSVGKQEPIKLTKEEIKAKFPEVKKEDIVIPKDQINTELQKAPEYQKRNKKRIQIQAQVAELSLSVPILPIKADNEAQKFSLDIIEQENPELVMYKNVQFQLVKGQKISPNHANQNWNNVRLEKREDHGVLITFSKTNSHQKVQYKAIPVLDGEDFEKALQAYNEHISKSDELKSKLKDAKKQIKFFRKEVKNKAITKAIIQAKLDRIEQIAALEKTRYLNLETSNKVTRYFEVNSMGVFNCDRIKKMNAKKPMLTKSIKFSKKVDEVLIYHVFKKLNGHYQSLTAVNNPYVGYKNSSITLGISKNKIGILSQSKNGSQTFTVKGTPKHKEDLSKWLEF